VAKREGVTVGYAVAARHASAAHLDHFAVHLKHQHVDVGTELLGILLQVFFGFGAKTVVLSTQNDNSCTQRLHRGLGFSSAEDLVTAWCLPIQ
jgi:ribosomal protein S18 acetylase RimI-like enzyme